MGRTLPFIVARESDAVPLIRQHVASGTIVHADKLGAWERCTRPIPCVGLITLREYQR